MRYLAPSLILILTMAVGSAVRAEDDAQPGERPDRGPDFRQRMLEQFDADGDGELSEAERATAREQRGKRAGDKQAGKPGNRQGNLKGNRGERPAGQEGRRGGRGDRGPGNQGPGGRQGPPDPDQMFQRLDKDGDGQLSREEFAPLARRMQQMHERRGQGEGRQGQGRQGQGRQGQGRQGEGRRGERGERFGQGPPEGRGDRRGPPRDRQRDFGPPDALQNPGDRPGPPRQGEGRRQREFGGQERGRGGEGRPGPQQILNRFDADNNGQLNREELGEMMHTMHERRQRGGQAGGDRFRPNRGRDSDQPGPPNQSERRRRPRRPELE